MLIDEVREVFSDGGGCYDVPDDITLVEKNIVGHTRWGVVCQYIFSRDNEYVEVVKEHGATEYQEDGYDAFDIYSVTPVEVVKYSYVRN